MADLNPPIRPQSLQQGHGLRVQEDEERLARLLPEHCDLQALKVEVFTLQVVALARFLPSRFCQS